MTLANKQYKIYDKLKTERDNFNKYRNMLETQCALLDELGYIFTKETENWRGIIEWKELETKINKCEESLIPDALFSAGVILYFGPFNWYYRNRIRGQWLKILQELLFNINREPLLSEILGTPEELADLSEKNLVKDEVCIENVFIMKYSKKWPILIDPECAALKWLGKRNYLEDAQKYFRDELVKNFNTKGTLIINITTESIDPDILKLLEIQRFRNAVVNISLNSSYKSEWNAIEINPEFSFILRIEWSNPKFTDYVIENSSLINFELSPQGLKDMLMIEYCLHTNNVNITNHILQKETKFKRDCRNFENTIIDRKSVV